MSRTQKAGSVLDKFERTVDKEPGVSGCGRGWEWGRMRGEPHHFFDRYPDRGWDTCV